MVQPRRELTAQPEVLCLQLFGNLFQRLQMRGRIAISKCMICDEVETALEEGAQSGKGGHG